ncbi:MAG: DNA-directed RNA polymerase subunit omega [Proteobacteria bacterium]|nr:DNA-directed RNA polymerase subunit omega [Pseudomonadota bacterium]
MSRITCEDCLEAVGKQNRFKLIHLAVQRVRQHRQGEPFLVEGKNKEIVMTLREIAASKVTFANIDKLPEGSDTPKKKREIENVPELALS